MIPPKQSFSQRMQSIQQQPMQGSQQNGLQSGANGMPSQIQQSADQQQINQDAPMGDPIDTIAQMLGLDLSAAASPDQQGQMVASAVEALVLQLHQYVDQFGMLDGSQAPDDQLDDQQQNYEDDGNEVAGDGEGQEGADTTQTDGEGVDESQDAVVGDGTQQGTKPQFPPKKKAIAASFFAQHFEAVPISARVLNGVRRGREMQLLQLAQEGYITPVMFKELKQEFCSTNALSLSLSQDDDAPDEFDTVCARFVKNGKLLELSSGAFGAQDGYRVLSQSKGEEGDDPQNSALVKAAEARNEQIERKKKRIASY